MNYLMLSVGRRGELLKNFRKSISKESRIIATDLSPYAPALYFADKQYLVPRIDDPAYVDIILDICKRESIDAVTTFIDPEIEILALNRDRFVAVGVEVLAPYKETAKICFNKYLMYQHLLKSGIPTVTTWGTLQEFDEAFREKKVSFPVFVKPREGSGSVGARKVYSYEELTESMKEDPSLIVQEFMDCLDLDADVYIDTITHEAVSVFAKKKVETRIGGASKTISFKDEKLFDFISQIVKTLQFNGPVDMDFFYRNGQYFLSEVNPRFGGAYLHAYGAGVDFIKLIENNLHGIANEPSFGDYEDDVVMMMYDSVVIKKTGELAER
ncbi:ATP-grasp domain-containing protein [Flavonifractor sp. An4]|uniref:ATP-grasp domain-containing protein n=1 Tax=Flavonifractor sp. An4 TaxID=1965634 RepID=UPI000B3A237A|nr:ATP-grasp domain-containing protein [Flavonifractor sp. An4]OUO14923.1 carbamoyl phosphate synthase [Flavonifractor sp. An4]